MAAAGAAAAAGHTGAPSVCGQPGDRDREPGGGASQPHARAPPTDRGARRGSCCLLRSPSSIDFLSQPLSERGSRCPMAGLLLHCLLCHQAALHATPGKLQAGGEQALHLCLPRVQWRKHLCFSALALADHLLPASQEATGLTTWQQAALVRAYALTRMQQSRLLELRRRLLCDLEVRPAANSSAVAAVLGQHAAGPVCSCACVPVHGLWTACHTTACRTMHMRHVHGMWMAYHTMHVRHLQQSATSSAA